MGKAGGAARMFDALLVWLAYCAFVLMPDLVFYFVFGRHAGMGTLPPVPLLALGAAASALTAALMAATGKWREWPRVRLSLSQLHAVSAASVPLLLSGQADALGQLIGLPTLLASYGIVLMVVGAWLLGDGERDKPKAALLLALAFASTYARHAVPWLGSRGYGAVAAVTAGGALLVSWIVLGRVPFRWQILTGWSRARSAITLATVIAACWWLGATRLAGETRPGMMAPFTYVGPLQLATVSNESRTVHAVLDREHPLLTFALELEKTSPLCEVSLFGETHRRKTLPVEFEVYFQTEGIEQKRLAQTQLSLPVDAWQSLMLDANEFAGKRCVVTISSTAPPDVAYSIYVSVVHYQKRSPEAYNLLLVCLDGVRADHLGCYGYGHPTSPAIDSLAAEGVRFEKCNAQAPWSFPSLFSMLIGEFPSVMWADQPIAEDARHFCDKAPMLALLLGLSGYHTAAITDGGPAGPYGGLQQGFHSYRVTDQPGIESTYRHASDWLNRHAGERFFLFVQSYEALAPYRKAMFTPSGPGEREQVVAAYDTDIVHADMLVGLLCGELRRLGILDKTLVVITSAHGQDFARLRRGPEGLEGTFGHALTQSLLHVPLIMRAPGLIPPGQVVSHRVALMDVAPTVLALLGMQRVTGPAGWNLKALSEGKEYPDPGRPIYSEATCWGPERKALVKANYKLVVTPVQWEKLPEWERRLRSAPGADPEQVAREFGADQVCLYDLTADPLEEHNIATAHPDALADCIGALRAIMERNEALREQHKKMVLGFAGEP